MTAEHSSLPRVRRLLLVFDVAVCVSVVVLLLQRPDVPLIDAELLLPQYFPSARPVAFDGVNRLTQEPFPSLVVCWMTIGAACIVARRYKPLVALVLGPIVAATMIAVSTDWSDPGWFKIGSVVAIGFLVGSFVSLIWLFSIHHES